MENKNLIQFNLRIEPDIKHKLKEIAALERKKTGFRITPSNLAAKVITEFVKKYK